MKSLRLLLLSFAGLLVHHICFAEDGRLSPAALKAVKKATVYLRVTTAEGSVKQGSGFFGEEPNLVVTNAHVLGMLNSDSKPPSKIEIVVNSGEKDEKTCIAEILGVDRSSDLAALCRKRRMVGFQGVSARSTSQRQSPTVDRTNQVGTPRAPARWAAVVSTVITRSRHFITAAVSRNAEPGGPSRPPAPSPKLSNHFLARALIGVCPRPLQGSILSAATSITSSEGEMPAIASRWY
jgi:hypothetical protein